MANRRFGGPQRGGRGFLPNANVNPWQGNTGPATNNLNSSNLQTQLALALSSLLQPQQVNEPPSLLSLNTSPGNFNQDNYSNRLGPRGRSDFRRSEPYNKNQRSGWRNDRSHNRGPMSHRARSNAKDKNASKDKAKPDKKSSDNKVSNEVSQKSDVKDKDEKQVDNVDENRDEEGSDTKRDWKEEKNTSEEKKEAGDEKEKEDGAASGEKSEKGDKSKYAGLYNSLFHCFVCNKSMWDADSFKNHIRGRAHIQMMDSLEESFQITVKILRENMRLSEEKKMIEWNRMQRNNRKFHSRNEPESHCNMCDLKFVGKIIAHRKTEGHQRLKRFLHPNCDTCNLEFPSRMEWVEHRFTPEHLFKVKEILDTKSGDTEGHIIEENLEWENEPLLQENLQTEDENPVLELDDDLANLYNRVPVYRADRPVGKNSLKPLEGFFCEVCNRFLRNETDSQNHLKSEKHYHQFIMAVKSKFRANVEKAEEEGNWKRKKGGDGDGDGDGEGEGDGDDEEEKGDNEDDAEKKAENGDDMYDPEEACKEGVEGEEEEKSEDTGIKKEEEDITEVKTEEKTDDEIKVKQEEEDDDVIIESENKAVSSPTTRRRGAVKNGAGPKSKKVRK